MGQGSWLSLQEPLEGGLSLKKPAGCRPQGTEQMSLYGNTRGYLHNEGILSCTHQAGGTQYRNEASSDTPSPPAPHLPGGTSSSIHLSVSLKLWCSAWASDSAPLVSGLAQSACEPLPSLLSSAPSLSLCCSHLICPAPSLFSPQIPLKWGIPPGGMGGRSGELS